MIDVSPAISRLAKDAILTKRESDSYDNGGNAVSGDETATPIKAVVMQITASELRDLPEGIRDEADAVCWTLSDVETDDLVEQDGVAYRVMKAADRKVGKYHRAIVGRTNDGH